jgi:hypothetical protein
MGYVRSEFIDAYNSSRVPAPAVLENIAEGSIADGDTVVAAVVVAVADKLREEDLPLPRCPHFAANLLHALLEHLHLPAKAAEKRMGPHPESETVSAHAV